MKESIRQRLESLVDRFEELSALLSDPSVISNQDQFRDYSREYSDLEPIVATFNQWCQAKDDQETALQMMEEDDADLKEMAQEELKDAKAIEERLEDELQILMLP